MNLLQLYIPLILWVGFGVVLGRILPSVVAQRLGFGLFWIGVPVGIMIFLRQADLTAAVWVAPIVCWVAVFLGAAIAWFWLWLTRHGTPSTQTPSTQGSFLNAAMFGNTGYLGYPVTLALVGPKYFAWAVFYDTLGSTLATYGLGVALASNFGNNAMGTKQSNHIQRTMSAVIKNPALWSFFAGLGFRHLDASEPVETVLRGIAWAVVALSLLLLGMRLSQVSSRSHLTKASVSLGIKMLIVPSIVGVGVSSLGITGAPRLVLVLQAAMPPAFATLILAEAYHLDRDLTVTTLAIGSIGFLLTLPIWLTLFG